MSHVDEGTLHALVDDALDATERGVVEAHLASCGDCARRFAEATAMARQVATLLGALDAPEPRVRIAPPPVGASAPEATPIQSATRRTVFTLRRVALAASLLLVAGVSYEVGKGRERAPLEVATPSSAPLPREVASLQAAPSVAEVSTDSFVAAAAPSVREQPRGGPRSETSVIVAAERDTGAASREATVGFSAAAPLADASKAMPAVSAAAPVAAQGSVAQSMAQRQLPAATPSQNAVQAPAAVGVATDSATTRRPATAQAAEEAQDRVPAAERARKGPPPTFAERRMERPTELSNVVVTGVAESITSQGGNASASDRAAPKAIALAGYTVTEDSLPATVTRRRYVSPGGTALELLITPSADTRKLSGSRRDASEFVVTTANGRSVVRWQSGAMEYSLAGALAPDSLMKLATRLKP